MPTQFENCLFDIEGVPEKKLFKKLRSYVAIFEEGILIEYNGELDVYKREDIYDVFIKEPVVVEVGSRTTIIEFFEEGEQFAYTLEDSVFPGLSEKMERLIENEWSSVTEKHSYGDTIKWFVACCAVVQISSELNPAIFGGNYREPENIAGQRKELYESWGFNSQNDFRQMLPKLLAERSVVTHEALTRVLAGEDAEDVFDDVMELDSEGDVRIFTNAYDRELLRDILSTGADPSEEYLSLLGALDRYGAERCMQTWDWQRLILLSALGYVCDYLDWNEALETALAAAVKLQGLFSGWDEFMGAYLAAYSFWALEDIEDTDSEVYERKRIYEHYKKLMNNPWRVPWDTPLRL